MNISVNASVSPSSSTPVSAPISVESDTSTSTPVTADWLKIKLTSGTSSQDTTSSSDEVNKEINNVTAANSTGGSIVKPFLTKNVVTATVNTQNSASFLKHKPVSTSNIVSIQTTTAPKNIIKSNPVTPINLAQLTKNNPNPVVTTSNFNIPTTVNVNSRKINVTTSSPANTAIINNLVKNIQQTNNCNTATANAVAAVTAAASMFSQMNTDQNKIITKTTQQHPIITTLMSSENVQTSSEPGGNTSTNKLNQINIHPPSTLNLPATTATTLGQNQPPKITVLSNTSIIGGSNLTTIINKQSETVIKPSSTTTIKQPPVQQNRINLTTTKSTTTTTTTNNNNTNTTNKPKLALNLKTTTNQPLNHLIPLTSTTNNSISNIVTGLNIKSLSPISFLPTTTTTATKSPQTPPPTLITNHSNYISNRPISNLTNQTIKSISSPSSVSSNETPTTEETVANQAPPTFINNISNTNSQTIAQLCNQPIRLSQAPNQNVQLHQITLNSLNLNQISNNNNNNNNNTNNNYNNNNNINKQTIPSTITTSSTLTNNNVNVTTSNQGNSSPYASPLKPNIIRKSRRDSPSNLNTVASLDHSNQINLQVNNYFNQQPGKHPIYELTAHNTSTDNSKNNSKPTTTQTTVHLSNMSIDQLMLLGNTNTDTTTKQSSSSKSILNLMAESQQQQQQQTSGIRKFTFNNTQLNIPSTINQITSRPVLNYSKKIKNSTGDFQIIQTDQHPAVKQPQFISSQIANLSLGSTDQDEKNAKSQNQVTTVGSRKRRKQEFSQKSCIEHLNLVEASSNCLKLEECLSEEEVRVLSKEFRYVASNGMIWTTKRQHSEIPMRTINYRPITKVRKYHLERYSDIKKLKKDETPTGVQKEAITKNELVENLNEWKFHFVISQVKSLIEMENESLDVIKDIERYIEKADNDGNEEDHSDITVKINESIKANSQRHQHVNQQLDETQELIYKLFEHKEKFKNYLLFSTNKSSKDETSKSIELPSYINHSSKSGFKSKNNLGKKGINTRGGQIKAVSRFNS